MTEHQINCAISFATGKLKRLMTDEEYKAALLAWANDPEPDPYCEINRPNKYIGEVVKYTESLDACAEFEKLVDDKFYSDKLTLIIFDQESLSGVRFGMVESRYKTAKATPLQRCEAFLRVKRKWNE